MSVSATVSSLPIPPSPNHPNLDDFRPATSRPASSASTGNRPPTLHFPSLHLGSFDTLTASPQPFSYSPLSPTTNSSHSTSANSPLRKEFDSSVHNREGDGSGQGQSRTVGVGRDVLHGSGSGSGSNDIDGTRLSVQPSRSSSHHSSRSSHRLHRDKSQLPPPLPPPTMALPPLPILSPISPIGPSTPTGSGSASGKGIQSTLFQPSSNSSSSSSLAQQLPSPTGSRQLPTVPTRGRPLGHSLTISIPGPLTPSSERDSNPLHSPILKNSPGVARRRTVIENNGTYHASPVKVSAIVGTFTPPRDTSPTPEKRSPPVQLGSVMMPQPTPTPKVEQKASMDSPTRRLEKKRSSIDLKDTSTSPTASPTAKRSLPRPPRIDPSLTARPSIPEMTQPTSTARLQTAAPTDVATASHTKPQQSMPESEPSLLSQNQTSLVPPHTAPVPSSSWPPLNVTRSPQTRTQALPADLPAKPTFYQKHQANKSASSLPVVAGLADAGPYSGAAFSRPAVPNGVGIGRPAGQPAAGPSRPTIKPPQEEVCLECMMRDRDLADVVVAGDGVWERNSDADWRDLEWREQALLKSMGNLDDNTSITSILGRAVDESSEDSDSTSVSRPSTGNSREDVQLRRAIEEKNRRRSLIHAKKREADWRVVNEVGWKGFKWEEGEAGEGLPRGFRGNRGGKLTEQGIKAVMTKFPSASAHRYQTLQTYLRQQWMLVLEVRGQAQRLGRFPFPDDIVASSSTVSSHESQSMAFVAPSAASAMDQFGGAFTPVRQTPALSIVRPSPSSPANLTGLASAPARAAPLQRPLTHFLPDREPSPSALRTPQYGSPASATSRVRHGKQGSSPGVLERSPQRSGTYEESNEELWSPDEATGGNLRPFSFAVRAGAAAARDGGGSDGHGGRRSLWGRFGGSVTSLFGGSQNGSGSMMDMHLGLDNERRNRSSSFNVNSHPRAVSLASPTRPSFFSRDSRCSSVIDADQTREPRVSRVISHSRLSQMRLDDEEPDEEETQTKKKGIKGFFKKMKPKGARSKKSEPAFRVEDEPRRESETPLAPPPSMSYLAGNRKHNRNRSGSSSSVLTDGQESNQGRRYSASLPYGMRSVSAPMNGAASSSGGSLSASPTSSKFATSGPKRESYASARRQSVTRNDMGEESDKRGSVMEMLSNGGGAGAGGASARGMYTSPEPQMIYDEPTSMYHRSGNPGYPNQQFRPHNKTTSSFSVSSGTMAIETPPPALYNSNTFFNHQVQSHQPSQHQQPQQNQMNSNTTTPIIAKSPSAQLSPNRFKNLPPLPPPGSEQAPGPGVTASPDSFAAAFPDQEINLNLNGTVHDPKYLANQGYQQGPPHQQQKIIDFTAPNVDAGRLQAGRGGGGILQSGRGQVQAQSYGYPQPMSHQAQAQAQAQMPQGQGFLSAHARALATGRASFDQLTPRGRVGQDARAVKTMYGQPLISDLGPVGGYDGANGMEMGMGTEKKKKGFKALFGGSKAGRMA
ncbi:hypothetical protein IAT40_002348 [Kwoniella sp. CBS 6097]